MSRSDKDKAGGHIRRSKGLLACGCCTTLTREMYADERSVREHAAMAFERNADVADELITVAPRDQHGHQFFAGRCLRCSLRWLDLGLPGVEPCPVPVEDDPVFYTTTTEGIATLSHPIL